MFINPWLNSYNSYVSSLDRLRFLVIRSNLGVTEKISVIKFYKASMIQALDLFRVYLQLVEKNQTTEDIINKGIVTGLIDDAPAWEQAIKDKDITFQENDLQQVNDLFDKIRFSYYSIMLKLKDELEHRM